MLEMTTVLVPLHEIDYNNDHNIRRDLGDLDSLAKSLEQHGVLDPVLLRLLPDDSESIYRYRVVDGFRRCNAAGKAHLKEVPARVLPTEVTEQECLETALTANLHSSSLNVLDEAAALGKLRDTFKLNAPQIAEKLSLEIAHVHQTMGVLNYPDLVKNALYDGTLPVSHAREIIRLPHAYQQTFLDKVKEDGLSLKKLRKLIDNFIAKLGADKAREQTQQGPTDYSGPSKAEVDEFERQHRELQKQRRVDLRTNLVRLSRAFRPRSEHEVEHIDFGRLDDETILRLLNLTQVIPTYPDDLRAAIERLESPDEQAREEGTDTAQEQDMTLVFWGGSESKAAKLFHQLLGDIEDIPYRTKAIGRIQEISRERIGGGHVRISIRDVEMLASELNISLEKPKGMEPV